MAFGMGCCCLQVTFQCRSIQEARHLYDQLAVLGPIMMALTAASPFFKGFHFVWEDNHRAMYRLRREDRRYDARWNVISEAVDDRSPYERNLTDDDGGRDQLRLSKSRYRLDNHCHLLHRYYTISSSIDCYIGTSSAMDDSYNDVPVAFHDAISVS